MLTFFVTLLGTCCQAQTTLIERIDIRRGNVPYNTTGLVFANSLELWAFGNNRWSTADLEVGYTPCAKGNWSLSGYAVWWPDAKEAFVMPWVSYHSPFLHGQLTLNIADYVPVRHGPHILFSDSSRILWKVEKRINVGIGMNYAESKFTAGPQVELSTRDETVRLRWLLPARNTPSALRVEVIRRF